MKMQDKKGFTLAELLIVVAIIAVLVAISIPIFSGKLEKSRDATSVANLRTAYSQAMAYTIEYNGTLTSTSLTPPDNKKVTLYGGPLYGGNITAVIVKGVYLHSSSPNNWSDVGDDLPFYNMITTNDKDMVNKKFDTKNNGDTGKYDGYYNIEFYFWSKDLNGQLQSVYIIQTKYDSKGNLAG